jgi:hypothetical protein
LYGRNVPARAALNPGVRVAASKDKLLQAIDAVHSAGLEEELWPRALGAATRLLGANCATFETLEVPGLQHLSFLGFNTPPAAQLLYLREFVQLSPRSANTAYTHLRRIKEKTGCKHMAELIRWLNDLHLPLRRDK